MDRSYGGRCLSACMRCGLEINIMGKQVMREGEGRSRECGKGEDRWIGVSRKYLDAFYRCILDRTCGCDSSIKRI
jgi:hypothetical protein